MSILCPYCERENCDIDPCSTELMRRAVMPPVRVSTLGFGEWLRRMGDYVDGVEFPDPRNLEQRQEGFDRELLRRFKVRVASRVARGPRHTRKVA